MNADDKESWGLLFIYGAAGTICAYTDQPWLAGLCVACGLVVLLLMLRRLP